MTTTSLTADDRADIAAVLIRYASGIDGRDWPLFRTCFTPDCEVDYGDIGAWSGIDELTEWMDATHAPMGHTLHRITNIAVDPAPDRDGDRAIVRAYVDALLMMADGTTSIRAAGFYDDELIRTPDGWRIHRRAFTSVHIA